MFYALLCAMLGIIGCAITLYFLSHGGIEEEPPFMDAVPETNDRPLDGNPFANARTIEPNDTYFPWSDVQKCLDKKLYAPEFTKHRPCPRCARPSDELEWIKFSSSEWTWKHMAGRAGPLSICPACKIQVQFICHVMN